MLTTALASSSPRRALAAFAALALAILAAAGCGVETTRRWDLVHDRIVAVAAGAPGLAPGDQTTFTVLITSEAAGPTEVAPMLAAVVPGTPDALADVVSAPGGVWTVTAPDAATLDQVRAELALAAGAPVPLQIVVTVTIDGTLFAATKALTLGTATANPTIDAIRVDGTVADGVVQAGLGERELAIDADDTDDVAWFTQLGELDDQDDAIAHLTVDEPGAGTVVVVRRTEARGVAWRLVALSFQ